MGYSLNGFHPAIKTMCFRIWMPPNLETLKLFITVAMIFGGN